MPDLCLLRSWDAVRQACSDLLPGLAAAELFWLLRLSLHCRRGHPGRLHHRQGRALGSRGGQDQVRRPPRGASVASRHASHWRAGQHRCCCVDAAREAAAGRCLVPQARRDGHVGRPRHRVCGAPRANHRERRGTLAWSDLLCWAGPPEEASVDAKQRRTDHPVPLCCCACRRRSHRWQSKRPSKMVFSEQLLSVAASEGTWARA